MEPLLDLLSAAPWWVICLSLTLLLFIPIFLVIKLLGFGKPEESSTSALDQPKDYFKQILEVTHLTVATALCVAGLYCWHIAQPGNALATIAMLLVALGLGTFWRILRMRPSIMQWLLPSFSTSATSRNSSAFKLGNDALKRARQLQEDGTDLETICHTVNPDYSNSTPMQQQTFRLVLETVLDKEPAREA